jgi:hypothetical protein
VRANSDRLSSDIMNSNPVGGINIKGLISLHSASNICFTSIFRGRVMCVPVITAWRVLTLRLEETACGYARTAENGREDNNSSQ